MVPNRATHHKYDMTWIKQTMNNFKEPEEEALLLSAIMHGETLTTSEGFKVFPAFLFYLDEIFSSSAAVMRSPNLQVLHFVHVILCTNFEAT